ncbi:neprilysin-1-like [Amblyomma americanum]
MVKGFTYCMFFIVAVGVAAFISVAALEIGESSGEGTEVEAIGGSGIDTRSAVRTAKKERVTRRSTTKKSGGDSTITEDGTLVAMKLINASLNWDYPPCDDFYKFVCSRLSQRDSTWMQTEGTHITIKSMLSSTKVPPTGQTAAQKAAGLFQACVRLGSGASKGEVESLMRFLSMLGLEISSMTPDPNFDITQRIVRLSLEYGFPTYVKFGYFKVPRTSRKTLEMSINTEDEEWILTRHKYNSDEQLLESYSNDLDIYANSLDSTALARRIIHAEVIVQESMPALRTSSILPIWTTVGDLGRFTIGTISEEHWEYLITQYTGSAFKARDTVSIRDNATGLAELLMDDARLRRDDSRLLVAWTLLHKLLPFADEQKMTSLATEKYGRQQKAVTDFCYDAVSDVMALAASQQYFSQFVPQSALGSAHWITTDVIEALKTKIKETEWIQGDAWCVMSDKAKYLQFTLGFPEGLSKESQVESFYADFPNVGANFFDPYLESHRLLTTREFRGNLNAKFNVTAANAAYNPVEHSVDIYAGLLQPPFFINNGPAAMNYGGLGQRSSPNETRA